MTRHLFPTLKRPFSIYGIISLILVYRILLDISYLSYVQPQHFYNGFGLSISPLKTLFSLILLIAFTSVLPRKDTISSSAIQFFFLFVYLPMSSYFNLGDTNWLWFGLFQLFWIVLLLTTNSSFHFKQIKTVRPKTFRWVFVVLLFFTISIILTLIQKINIQFSFDLYAVYEIRAENPQEKIPLGNYSVNWIAKVILPFLVLWFLTRKTYLQKSLFIFPAFAILLLFFMTGHKAYLFNIPFIILCWLLIYSKQFLQNLLITLISVLAICLIALYLFNEALPISLFVRRTLFIPAQLSFYYHDFFNGQPIYLSNSILKSLIDYPFTTTPPYLIADYYLGKPEMSANNGIISDGFMQFGIWGILLWGFLFGWMLNFISDIGSAKNTLIFSPLFLMGLKTWIDGALLTGLLTHGIGITVMLLLLYPSKDKERQSNKLLSAFNIRIKKSV